MKLFTNLFLIIFISFAAYLLLNEQSVLSKRLRGKKEAEISSSTSKVKRQIPVRDPFLFEIQRQQINSETIYKFQSNKSNKSYELHESELDKLGM